MTLRFFSSKVFGAWVDAYVAKITRTHVHLRAHFYGARWNEVWPITTEFYYPQGHPQAGEAFLIQERG